MVYIMLAASAVLAAASTRSIPASLLLFFSFGLILTTLQQIPLWAGAVSLMMLVPSFLLVKREQRKTDTSHTEQKLWRIILRPFAVLFIPIEIHFGTRLVLTLIGLLLLTAVITDIVRMFSSVNMDRLFKKGERKKFSSVTAFLLTCFILFLVFSPPISYLSLVFFSIGDLFGKLIGLRCGRIRLINHRTLEGSLGFVLGSLYAGYVIYVLLPFPEVYLFAGAAAAALVELFSKDVDDNLTVGICTAVILQAVNCFFLL